MLTFLLISSASSLCTETKYFTDCDKSYKHDVVLSRSADCTDQSSKIIKSVPCDHECPAGKFFQVSNSYQGCSLCPLGTFGVGGGFYYGREGEQWPSALQNVINDCWARENLTDYHNYDCRGWQIEEGVLASNQTSDNKTYTASLTFSLKLVKPGNFSLRYRKDTMRVNGKRVGTFSVSKNYEKVLDDSEIDQSNWKTFVVQLDLGLNEVTVDYVTRKVEDLPFPKSYIAHVQVVGTQFADTECYKCPYGGNTYGATSCGICNFNEYLKDEVCSKCPEGTYAYKGATSVGACLPRYKCSENDYKPVYSPCVRGQRNKTYAYKEPVFCNTSDFQLPSQETGVSCELCKPGYLEKNQSDVSVCEACPAGAFLEMGSNECLNCTAGRYARRQLNITDWTDLPERFSTYCLKYDGLPCLHSTGWMPLTHYLTTGLDSHRDAEIFLNRYVNIEGNLGAVKVDFEFVTDAGGFLDVYVDREFVETWNGTKESPAYIQLGKGTHYVQWVYWNILAKKEEVRIKSIKIHGADEGAASRCIECPDGSVSDDGQAVCKPCPPGTSSNSDKSKCTECPLNTYSNSAGSRCMRCPTGTRSIENRTNCIGIDYAYFNNSSYFLGNITGAGLKEGYYLGGICNMPSAKLYCHQTFYGPLPGATKDFYVSVLNPAELSLPYGEFIDTNSSSFAFSVYETKDIDNCVVNKRIFSLGRVVSSVKLLKNGISIHYSQGDQCLETSSYSSSIDLICDKSTGIGWPSFDSQEACTYKFKWISKYGCPICLYHQMKTVKSQCVDGVRTIKKVETHSCILPFDEKIEWTESCSVVDEVLYELPMIIGFSLLGLLLIMVVISLAIYWKYKKGYDRLSDASDKV